MKHTEVEKIYRIIRQQLKPHFSVLEKCESTSELKSLSQFQAIESLVQKVLEFSDVGGGASKPAQMKERYRFVGWNLERGIQFDDQLATLRDHPYLSKADVFLLTETDVGMARSNNRSVAQELALALGMYYAFVPCYLNLSKGAGIERESGGLNELGLHGNAILSRYPMRNVRHVCLRNGKDKMAGREKRLGRQTAIVADIDFPNFTVAAVAVHLDAQSSQKHRRDQMQDVLDCLDTGPTIIGGDWNTTTYNSSRALNAILGFWLRVFMGVDNVIKNHYLRPYQYFEKELFELIKARGFDYSECNRLGERTTSYDVEDAKTNKNLREWVPAWCFTFIRWALRNHNGKCPLKIDWFASRGLCCEDPEIIRDVREGRTVPLSDHDAIGVDVVMGRS
tara:strand:+ start:10543 stop:11724 length:1182 start_codon:yes stop_codon:yes gene_type:complete